jgi:hypothetical protein
MSKKVCFRIFAVSLIIILASFIINFAPVTSEISKVFTQMQNIYLSVSAVVIALLLKKQRHYWLIMIGIAVIASIIIQLLIAGGSLLTIALLYKIIAFIIYVYLTVLIRYML